MREESSDVRPATGGRSTARAGWAIAVLAVVAVAVVVGWRVASDDGTAPSDALAAGPELDGRSGPDPACAVDETVALLRSGLPTYDYQPAGSYRAAADGAAVIATGTITSIQRRVIDGDQSRAVTELTVADVATVDGGATDEIEAIVLASWWPSGDEVDPIGRPVSVGAVRFVAFLSPAIDGAGSWDPGVEGLYVACEPGDPAVAVVESAAGPGDPQDPTIDELLALVENRAGSPTTGESGGGPVGSLTVDEAGYLRDAIVSFAGGEAMAIEEIPLAAEVAIVLHDAVDRLVPKDELRDPAAWTIDRDRYADFSGPFNPLTTIARGPETEVTLGPHPHCVGDPLDPPQGYEDRLRISIQPAEGTIDSCIAWYAVDLFYDVDAGTIDAVSLALFGP